MWTNFAVVSSLALGQGSGLLATPKPLQARALVATLVVEGFVGGILSRLARIDVGGVDVDGSQPVQARAGGELGTVV